MKISPIPHTPIKKNNEETNLFLWHGRIDRKTYLIRFLFCCFLYLFLLVIFNYFQTSDIKEDSVFSTRSFGYFQLYVNLLILIVFVLIQRIKRMHDLNRSGWYSVYPFLVFKRGTDGPNEYGLNPGLEFPTYYDQRKDYERKYAQLPEKRKFLRRGYLYLLLISLFVFVAPLVIEGFRIPNGPALSLSNEDLSGLYSVKHKYGGMEPTLMFAEVKCIRENNFSLQLKGESGTKSYAFVRMDDGSLLSDFFGSGTIEYSEIFNQKRIVITFTDKKNTTWLFSK